MNMILTPKAKRTAAVGCLDENALIDFDAIAREKGITIKEVITRILRQLEFRVAALQRETDAMTKGANA